MSPSERDEFFEQIADALRCILDGLPAHAKVPPPRSEPAEETVRALLARLVADVTDVARFFNLLAQGRLGDDEEAPARENQLAGSVKELHSRLRELTWQAQQVAKGDYSQRVHFLGDFSKAFNTMVERLDEREQSLRTTVLELDQLNRQLRDGQETLKRAEIVLREQAIRDPLTGLFNRREAMDLLERAVHSARRHGHAVALAMCDVDNFKAVNDTHGHPAGDYALKRVAMILRECMRGEDVIGRYGGDEFLIMFPHTGGTEARIALQRLLDTVRCELFQAASGKTFGLSVSIGLTELGRRHGSGADLLEEADVALYRAKDAGRNTLHVA